MHAWNWGKGRSDKETSQAHGTHRTEWEGRRTSNKIPESEM